MKAENLAERTYRAIKKLSRRNDEDARAQLFRADGFLMACRILAGETFADSLAKMADKDAQAETPRQWTEPTETGEVIRYEHVSKDDPNRAAKLHTQREQFNEDAKGVKVLCLSDLMISHGM